MLGWCEMARQLCGKDYLGSLPSLRSPGMTEGEWGLSFLGPSLGSQGMMVWWDGWNEGEDSYEPDDDWGLFVWRCPV